MGWVATFEDATLRTNYVGAVSRSCSGRVGRHTG